jgi:hypothetical protein
LLESAYCKKPNYQKAGLGLGSRERNAVLGVDLQAVREMVDIYLWVRKRRAASILFLPDRNANLTSVPGK